MRVSFKNLSILLLALLVLATASTHFQSPFTGPSDAHAKTKSGEIMGTISSEAITFKGIPFAETTGGANRFMPPIYKSSWSGILPTKEYGPGCICNGTNPDSITGRDVNCSINQSEDCLSLNVFLPLTANPTKPNLPVYFFIYGGGFAMGAADAVFDTYNGSKMANMTEVIVVTFNYRLAGFGFFSVSDTNINGNMGIRDQMLALHWVRENIGVFGGDKDRITVGGESAGAMSAGILATSNYTQNWFSQSIMQSNPFGVHYLTKKNADMYGLETCRSVGCVNAQTNTCNVRCLQDLDVNTIAYAMSKSMSNAAVFLNETIKTPLDMLLGWKPIIDGNIIRKQPMELFEEGKINPKLNVVMGSTTHESAMFVYFDALKDITYDTFKFMTSILLGNTSAAKINNHYVEFSPARGIDAAQSAITDWWFACGNNNVMRNIKRHNPQAKIFNYRYNHVISVNSIWKDIGLNKQCSADGVVCHATELPFSFYKTEINEPEWGLNFSMTPDEKNLSKRIVTYWSNFIKTGDVNAATSAEAAMLNSPALGNLLKDLRANSNTPFWAEYDGNNFSNVIFNTNTVTEESRKTVCQMFDSIGYHVTWPHNG